VWADARNGELDIYMYDLSTGEETPVCTSFGRQDLPAISSGGQIVWEDSRNGNYDIYMYDIPTGQEVPICIDFAEQREPDISEWEGNALIVWQDYRNGNYDIYLCSLLAGATGSGWERGKPLILNKSIAGALK
jgi:beta propeller repeat protein